MRKTHTALCAAAAIGFCFLSSKGAAALPMASATGKACTPATKGESGAVQVRRDRGAHRWRARYWDGGYWGPGYRYDWGWPFGVGIAAGDWGWGYPYYGSYYPVYYGGAGCYY